MQPPAPPEASASAAAPGAQEAPGKGEQAIDPLEVSTPKWRDPAELSTAERKTIVLPGENRSSGGQERSGRVAGGIVQLHAPARGARGPPSRFSLTSSFLLILPRTAVDEVCTPASGSFALTTAAPWHVRNDCHSEAVVRSAPFVLGMSALAE